MEQLDQEQPQEQPENSLTVNIVRHGPSSYEQPAWRDIETADDLNTLGLKKGEASSEEVEEGKELAVAAVVESAEKLAAEISPDEEVIIWASPTGRTLETARIIAGVLEEKGITLRKKGASKEYGINVFERLGEVKNFQWKYFAPLINGGEVEINGKTFLINKEETNPNNLTSYDYFNSDAIENIPAQIKNTWPQEYVTEIDSFERFKEVSERSLETLDRLMALKDKKYRVIIVTHDAIAGSVINVYSPESRLSLNPGDFMSMERKGEDLVITRLENIA